MFESNNTGLSEDQIRSIVRDEIMRTMADFRIVGPGVSGQGNQWVFDPQGAGISSASSGGLPSGYSEVAATWCDGSGNTASGTILAKT